MLTASDKQMNPLGILENAHNVSVERRANELWYASFSLPENDPKNDLCSHFNYIDIYGGSGRYYGKYRIMPAETRLDEYTGSITYKCEHVLSTLLDDVILDYNQFTNYTTTEVLEMLLDMQSTKHWQVGQVDFERYFHYAFENENGLLAPILSIPKPFNEPYLFTFDTETYPWRLNLIRPSDDVMWDIIWGRDMGSFNEVSDPSDIVNRIFPKGAGEGVNQLTIEEVNNGSPYIEDADSIAEWGLHSYIWMDKRFEDAQSLKENAESLLKQWKDPKISFSVNAADLSVKEEFKHLERPFYSVGKIKVKDKTYEARIVGEIIRDLSNEHDVQYEINNKLDDIATTQADIERKIRVNEAYSQGATNIMNFSYQDNADNNVPALIPIYIDDDVVNVNTCELTFRTKPFRAYSQATEGGGATVATTSSGGGTVTSTSSGGGQTTSAGGGTTTSTPSGGNHRHRLFVRNSAFDDYPGTGRAFMAFVPSIGVSTAIILPFADTGAADDIYTFDADGDHTHDVTIPNHTHTVSDHTHEVTVPNHSHEITLPDHVHDIKHGIYELNQLPTSAEIMVDGNVIPYTDIDGDRIDLVDYLEKDANGRIKRGRHEITIRPNDLARIEADVILRVFIQSRLGGRY